MKQDHVADDLCTQPPELRLMGKHEELLRDYAELAREKKNTDRRLERALTAKAKTADDELRNYKSIHGFYSESALVDGRFLSTASVAKEKDKSGETLNDARRLGGVPGRQNSYWNVTADSVMLILPASKRPRVDENGLPIGGAASNERNLLAKVITFCTSGLVSIRDIAGISAHELSLIAEDVRVKASNHRGGFRQAWNNEKPAEVLGDIHKDTLSRAVHAFNLAIDRKVVDLMRDAALIFLSVDSSTFGMYSMQSTFWATYIVVISGYDAAGNALMEVQTRSGFLNALPVESKGTVACKDRDGNEMHNFAAEKFALSLVASGVDGVVMSKVDGVAPNVSVGVDGGNEGSGSGPQVDTQCHGGEGGYLNNCFITRKAFAQAKSGREEIVAKLDDFFQARPEDLKLREERPAPNRLRTDGKVLKLDGKTVSMQRNPLRFFALIYGGVPRTRYCNKHRVTLAFLVTMKVMIDYLKDLLSAVLFFRNVWVLMKVKPAVQGIFSMHGSRPTRFHIEAAAKIPSDTLERARNRLLRFGFKMLKEAAKTRWGTVQEGAAELHDRWSELVAAMPLALGEGTDKARLETLEAVFSQQGFRDRNMMAFSDKEGKNFWRMNDPAFRWGNMLVKFFQVTVWGPIMAASSDNKESSLRSMGGVGSVLRRILFFLQFRLFVHIPRRLPLPSPYPGPLKDAGTQKENARRHAFNRFMDRDAPCIPVPANSVEVQFPLAHRGVPIKGYPEGFLMLNSHLAKTMTVSDLPPKTESGMKHTYGRFHKAEMDTILGELSDTIQSLSELEPGDDRNFLPQGLRDLVKGPQTTRLDKRRALLASVRVVSDLIFQAILKYHDRDLYDPHGFFCGLIDVVAIPAKNIRTGEACEFMVSTHEGRANAAILELLIKELGKSVVTQLRPGESLGDYLTGPFGAFWRNKLLIEQLEEFRKAKDVPLPSPVIVNQEVMGLSGHIVSKKGDTISRSEMKRLICGLPQPFTAFPSLAEQAMIANAEPTNNSRVEGGHSLASGKWRAMMRRATARWWSATIRKKTMQNAQLEKYVKEPEFLRHFAAARTFCWKNSKELSRLWHLDLCAGAERDRMRKSDQLPLYVKAGAPFNLPSKYAPAVAKERKRKKPIEPASRQSGAKGNKRHRDSDNSEFEDSDVEPDEMDGDHDGSNQGINADDEFQDLDLPDNHIHDSDQSQGQEENQQSLGSSRRQCHGRQSNKVDLEPVAPVQAVLSGGTTLDSGLDHHDAAQSPLQGLRESDAVTDDDFADVDLDAIEAQAQGLTANSTNQGLTSEKIAPELEAADADDDYHTLAEIEAAELGAEAKELQKLLDRHPDSDVSESEHESQQHSLISECDRSRWVEVKAKNKPYQLEHARLLLLLEPWVDSKVTVKDSIHSRRHEGDKRLSSITVERADGIVIPVCTNDGNMLYLIAETTGPEMVYVTDIIVSSNGDAKIRYLRVLNTRDAYASCDQEEDLIETREGEHRSCVHTRRLGKNSLKLLLDSSGDAIHHWGDVAWETRAKHVVGMVGWLPVAQSRSLAESKASAIGFMKGKGLTQIKSPDDLSWVIVGEQFSDCNPEIDQPQEQTAKSNSSKMDRNSLRKSTSDRTKAARTRPTITGSGNAAVHPSPSKYIVATASTYSVR